MASISLSPSAKYTAWFLGILGLLFQMTIQLSSGSMVDGLTATFHLSAARAGFLAGAYYPIYCLLQIPAGLLIDRFGARNILVLGLTLAAWSMMFFSNAPSFGWAIFARLLAGVGLSCCFVALMDLIGHCFKASHFAWMFGLSETLVIAAVIALELILPDAVDRLSWQIVSRMLGLGLAILAAAIAIGMHDIHETQSSVNPSGTLCSLVLRELLGYIKDPMILGYGLLGGGIFSLVTVFEGLWAQPFYIHGWHRGIMEASQLNALLLAGVGVGAPLMGYLGQFKRYLYLNTVGLSILVWVLFTSLIHWGDGFSSIGLQTFLFMLGLTVSSYVWCYMIATEQASDDHYATANGFMNTLVVIPIPLIQPLIGRMLDASHHLPAHERYIQALMQFDFILAGMFILGWILIGYALYQNSSTQAY